MPYNWTTESEHQMLLMIIGLVQRPSPEIYKKVAEALGGGLNANAVRYDSTSHCFTEIFCVEVDMILFSSHDISQYLCSFCNLTFTFFADWDSDADFSHFNSQKFHKLRKESEKLNDTKSEGDADSAPSTPAKTPAKTTTPRKRKGKNEDGDIESTPVKKGRKKPTKKQVEEAEIDTPTVKEEIKEEAENSDENIKENDKAGDEEAEENGDKDGENVDTVQILST